MFSFHGPHQSAEHVEFVVILDAVSARVAVECRERDRPQAHPAKRLCQQFEVRFKVEPSPLDEGWLDQVIRRIDTALNVRFNEGGRRG